MCFRYNEVCSPAEGFSVDYLVENAPRFAQMIWKETTQLGIGRSTFEKDGKLCTVVVARYFPGAEWFTAKSNLFRGSFDHAAYCHGLGSIVDLGDNDIKKIPARSATPVSQNTQGLCTYIL